MTRIRTSFILWLALVASVASQDVPPVVVPAPRPIEVIGPSTPIAVNSAIFIPVNNLDEDEFLASTITINPSKGAIAFRIYGAPLVVFQGNAPGKYTVSVGRNVQHIEWQKSLVEATTYAKSVNAPAEFISRIEKLHADAITALPARGGSCVVEVAGSVVPPTVPTDPTKPPTVPPSTKVTMVTYVYEKDQNNVPRLVSAALQRINADSGGSIVATEFEEDSTVDGTPGGRVPSQYKVALEAARQAGLPALVVQAGSEVVRVVKAPTTTEAVLEAAK